VPYNSFFYFTWVWLKGCLESQRNIGLEFFSNSGTVKTLPYGIAMGLWGQGKNVMA
jgi:hypothetical protein